MKNFILVIVLAACFVGYNGNKSNAATVSRESFLVGNDADSDFISQKTVCHYIPDETSESSLSNCDTIVVHAKKINVEVKTKNFGPQARTQCEILMMHFEAIDLMQKQYLTLDPKSDRAVSIKNRIDTILNLLKSDIEVLNNLGTVIFSYDIAILNSYKDRLASLYPAKKIDFATNHYVDARLEVREYLVQDSIPYFAVQNSGLSKAGQADQPEGAIAIYNINLSSSSVEFQLYSNNKFLCQNFLNGNIKKSVEEILEVAQFVSYDENNRSVTKVIEN